MAIARDYIYCSNFKNKITAHTEHCLPFRSRAYIYKYFGAGHSYGVGVVVSTPQLTPLVAGTPCPEIDVSTNSLL